MPSNGESAVAETLNVEHFLLIFPQLKTQNLKLITQNLKLP